MKAIGVYIKELRTFHGMTQLQLATAVGTTPTQIGRYENGTSPNAPIDLLFRVVKGVKGRADDLMRLTLEENPTVDLARMLARQAQLTPEEEAQTGLFFESDEETRALLEAVYEASTHDKALRGEIRGFLAGLNARRAGVPSEAPPETSRRRRNAK